MLCYRSLTASRALTPSQAVEMTAAGVARGVSVLLHGSMAAWQHGKQAIGPLESCMSTCWIRGLATCRCSCSACSAVSQTGDTATGAVLKLNGCTLLRGCQRHSQLLQGLAFDRDAQSSLKLQARLLEAMPQLLA